MCSHWRRPALRIHRRYSKTHRLILKGKLPFPPLFSHNALGQKQMTSVGSGVEREEGNYSRRAAKLQECQKPSTPQSPRLQARATFSLAGYQAHCCSRYAAASSNTAAAAELGVAQPTFKLRFGGGGVWTGARTNKQQPAVPQTQPNKVKF